MELLCQRYGGTAVALQGVVSVQRRLIVGAPKCMYFLTHRDIAYITNLWGFTELCKSLEATHFTSPYRPGPGWTCTSTLESFMMEIV